MTSQHKFAPLYRAGHAVIKALTTIQPVARNIFNVIFAVEIVYSCVHSMKLSMVDAAPAIGRIVIDCQCVNMIVKRSSIHGISPAFSCACARNQSMRNIMYSVGTVPMAKSLTLLKGFAIANIISQSHRASGAVCHIMDPDIMTKNKF